MRERERYAQNAVLATVHVKKVFPSHPLTTVSMTSVYIIQLNASTATSSVRRVPCTRKYSDYRMRRAVPCIDFYTV